MALKDFRDAYYTYSGKASDITRQLGFAGIAIVWIFKTQQADKYSIPQALFWPAVLITTSLALDLLHYLVSSASWGIFVRMKERAGIQDDAEIEAPDWINWIPNALFWAKVALMGWAYVHLIRYMTHNLS